MKIKLWIRGKKLEHGFSKIVHEAHTMIKQRVQ